MNRDITDGRTALWRDANSDGLQAASEFSYYADPADADHDGDKLTKMVLQKYSKNTCVNSDPVFLGGDEH